MYESYNREIFASIAFYIKKAKLILKTEYWYVYKAQKTKNLIINNKWIYNINIFMFHQTENRAEYTEQ